MATRLGVISDTHGHLRNTREAIRLLSESGITQLIHCGDIGSPDLIPFFATWPTRFVFGNVDQRRNELRAAIERYRLTCDETLGQFELEGRRIAFLHGDDAKQFESLVASGACDLVCFGHTHRMTWQQSGSTQLLNPGAVYRARPHSVAVVTLPDLRAEFLTF